MYLEAPAGTWANTLARGLAGMLVWGLKCMCGAPHMGVTLPKPRGHSYPWRSDVTRATEMKHRLLVAFPEDNVHWTWCFCIDDQMMMDIILPW